MYNHILEVNLNGDYADDLPLSWIFQQDNDPKHCSRVIKDWLTVNRIKCLEWPALSIYGALSREPF